jgi:hypothetical protein
MNGTYRFIAEAPTSSYPELLLDSISHVHNMFLEDVFYSYLFMKSAIFLSLTMPEFEPKRREVEDTNIT